MNDIQSPNLDGMFPDELRKCEAVFSTLADYAAHKARAMELRAAGDVEAAAAFERAAEACYRRLPANVRW